MAYKFAAEELEPHAAEWDRNKHFPVDQFKAAAELGFGGIYVSEENGGCGLGRLEASLIFEALATGDVGTSAFISIHNMCAWMVDMYGTQE
jgi:alkylation response protein AidB-like acyl-CoA dehydrogenase